MKIKNALWKLLPLLLILSMILTLCAPSFALNPGYEMSASYKSGEYYQKLLNVTLTGDMRRDIVAVAKSQVGYHEGSSASDMAGNSSSASNYTEYGNFYQWYAAEVYGDHWTYVKETWCGMFISFCAYMAQIPSSIIRLTAQTPPQQYRLYGANANEGSSYRTVYDLPINGGTYVPLPGDIVFFGRSSSTNPSNVSYCHIGIVESSEIWYTDDGRMVITLNTIEGNSSNKVKPHAWKLYQQTSGVNTGWVYEGTYIAGFGIPAYTTSIEAPYSFDIGSYGGTLLRQGSSGLEVYKLQQALSLLKYAKVISTAVPLTGVMDEQTVAAAKAFQTVEKIEVDGLVGNETWTHLRTAVGKAVEKIDGDFIVDGSTLLLYKGSAKQVTVPNGVKTIAPLAFASSNLVKITIPRSLETIHANAFKNATKLKTVEYTTRTKTPTVASTGNAIYLSAEKIYTLPTYTVTFRLGSDSNAPSYTYTCEEGTIPVFNESTARKSDGSYIYYFVGWDRKFTAVTENTTYTAEYIKIPASPVQLLSSASVLNNGQVALVLTAEIPADVSVSSFDFEVQYAEHIGKLRYIGFSSEIINVETRGDGFLVVSMNNDERYLTGTVELATLYLDVDVSVKKGDFTFVVACDNGQDFRCTDGEAEYALNVSTYDAGFFYNRNSLPSLFYDCDGNGKLDISDVTMMLDILAGSVTPRQGSINAPSTIEDVTELLNILADC